MNKNIKHFLKDKNKKPYSKIFKETIELYLKNKSFPKHYFSRGFYHKDLKFNYKDFLDMNTYFKIIHSKNYVNPALETILYNKLSFGIFANKNNIPTPKIISHNFGNLFTFNNTNTTINNSEELKNYFNTIFQTLSIEQIFLKPMHGHQGMGMFRINKKTTSNKEYDEIYSELLKNPYLHQEVVHQHEVLNSVFSKTLNTLRIETYVDNDNNISFIGGFIRFGIGDSIVDNVSAGGIFVPLNLQTDRSFEYAYKSKYGFYEMCYEHPETKYPFKNLKIPFLEEAKLTVLDATKKLPKKLIGWDVAITPNGPLIIEGNFIPGLVYAEFSYNGYKNLPIYKKIIAEANA